MAGGGILPIKFTELLQLTNVGIAPASIGFNSCTLESDSFVCVRQKLNEEDKPQVIIVNLKNNNEVIQRPINADSAIMHWTRQVIALKAQSRTVQIFDLAAKAKLKSAVMNEDVVFWKWFSENSLGLVTDTAVYHWNVFDATQNSPVKMFDRNSNLAGCQIINYRVNDDEKWSVVVGISQKEGRVAGTMQLWSRDRGLSQHIEGHAAAFGNLKVDGQPAEYKLFTFAVRTAAGAKLHVVEIDPNQANQRFPKKAVDVYFPAEATNDFPVAMQISKKYSIIYMITKYGFIHLYDLETGSCIFMNRISSETIFITAPDSESSGIVGVNRKGQVLAVSVDDNTIIAYLLQNPANSGLAVKLASRAGLPGADDLYRNQFDQLLAQGNYPEAAKIAANSPRGFLRTPETINRFKGAGQAGGQMSVILQYFGMLLDKGSLNKYESVELIKPVLQQNRKHLLDKWMGEGKLESSEELGDIVRLHDLEMALRIYQQANVPSKVVAAMAETGKFDQILPYSRQVGYQPDFVNLLQHITRVNPEKGAEFATQLANEEGGPLVDIDRVVDIFMAQNMIQQATAFLLDALKENKPEQGPLQSRLLEMNLRSAPQVADAILGNEMFSYYDKTRIASMCEAAGLIQRALENSDDTAFIKRNIVKSDKLNAEWLISYFGRMSVEQSLDCMNEMLKVNLRQNLEAVVNIATKFSDLLGANRLIEMFERHRATEGLYHYLGTIVNLSEDPDVTFKYIEAATALGQFPEVERICRESDSYNPEKVKNFLIEARLTEQLPLIIVCDRFNFVKDLVSYLYRNQQYKSIEVYVQKVNPSRTPAVVGALLAMDCDENIIKQLLSSIDSSAVPMDELVSEVETHNRLKILLPFLESTLAAGNQQQAVYNALAKIYIAILGRLLSDTLLEFAPGLLDVVHSAVPPTIAYFKSLPTDVGCCWAVYLIVLEKPGGRPKIYIGSGTGSTRRIASRFYCYDARIGLPRYVERALDDGYTIVHKGLLCWSPIPAAGIRYPVVAHFLALEATFSIIFWAMKSRTKDYGMPHLCPWSLETMEYDGLCSHTTLAEGIRGELDGLSPEQIAAKEVAMEQRRIAQYRARNLANYYKLKHEDYPKWQAQRRAYAAQRDPTEKAATAQKTKANAIATQKHSCLPCGTDFRDSSELNIHKTTRKHLSRTTGVDRVYKYPAQHGRDAANVATRKYYCQTCNYASNSQFNLDKHNRTQKHEKKAKAAESTLLANHDPEKFLKENDLYDTLTVGKYCEKRDPNLAYIAYRKGQNDLELINITNENSMYRAQARYLLERADPEIWSFVLNGNNVHRRSLVDQVIATAVPESAEPQKVSVAVKAFLDADLPAELIELLEKIILEPSPFSDNGSLQNLLMLTAAKADKGRLMDYIQRLSEYNADEIANMCIDQGLFEEAFEIYKKVDNHSAATNVLVDHIVSIDRAQEYAERVELPEVWSKVAKAQLDGLRVTDSIDSYIKAQDPSNYNEVIETATHAGKDEDLVKFLKMARKTQREPAIDTALAFSYARLNLLAELEDFLRSPNVADIEASGDKAYEEGFHQAAKIFFTSISNWAKLATTLVHLEDYQAAVECARRANSVKVWKQVNEACVQKEEFRLAQICGLNLIVHAEELQDLVKQYEREGYFEELISLLEAGLGLERAHMGMFTELGLALSKYHPERVMEHLKLFWSRINIPKMIRGCEDAHLWPELIFLYCHYDEWDNAALAMMERAADAWEHHSFKDIIVKVANLEIYYRALNHYLQEQPLLLTDLLQALTPRIDVNRVVRMFEKSDNIPIIKPFLLNVQTQNKRTVNNAINDLLIEEEDYKTLKDSVENYDNYDAVELAQRLEKHELVFFRQIAAQIYRKNKRWDKSIALSKQDKLFKDAIETSAMSGKRDIVEDLLRYFVDIGSRECYVGMLYACYDLLSLDVVMEISWRHGLNDFTMPFMISYMSQQAATIETLRKDNEERKAREASQMKEEDNTPILGGRLMLTQGPASAPSPTPYGHTNGITPQPTGFPRAF